MIFVVYLINQTRKDMKKTYFDRCKDVFKMLKAPDGSQSMRLLGGTIYLSMVIECDHVQLQIGIGIADTPETIRLKIEEEIDAEKRRIEREDAEYEHPSIIQGRAFDGLTF